MFTYFHQKTKGHDEGRSTRKDRLRNGTRIKDDKNGFSQIIFRVRELKKEL